MNRNIVLRQVLLLVMLAIAGPLYAGSPDAQKVPSSIPAQFGQDKEKPEKENGTPPEAGSPDTGTPREAGDPPDRGQPAPRLFITSADSDLITLNFLNVDVREALSALAIEREINISAAQDVSGTISVHLFRMRLPEVLDAIALAAGLNYYKLGDLYYMYKPKTAIDPQAARLQMRIFRLKYTEVEKVQEILAAIPGIRMAKIHEPSKTIVVEDTPENIRKVETIVSHWDRRPSQVMIEAKILEIVLTDEMALGVNWNDILGDVAVGLGGFTRATVPTAGPVSPVPASGAGLFANVINHPGTEQQFSAALDFLRTKTIINTLSTPKILAIHGKPAKVQVGGQQGYRVTTTNVGVATETIEFIDTGTILSITPYIDEENNILLNVQPSINSAKLEQGIPVVSSTLVSTWLMAKDGQTVFIGGLIQNTNNKSRDSVPGLGEIPVLGGLFGRTAKAIGKSELVVLITPYILNAGEPRPSDLESIDKTGKTEQVLKREPLPILRHLHEFMAPMEPDQGHQ